MKDLLKYLLENITGTSELEVNEKADGEHLILDVVSPKEFIGLIIGKEGKTIKAIRNILRIKATLAKKTFIINVLEKEN